MKSTNTKLPDYSSLNIYRAAYPPKLGFIVASVDARAGWPLVLLFADKSTFTFGLVILSVLVFSVLSFYGYSLDVALKRLRASMAGRRRYTSNYRIRQRRFASGF